MKYTHIQYWHMCESVNSYLMEAEHHNWRILNHLSDNDPMFQEHEILQEKLRECQKAIYEIRKKYASETPEEILCQEQKMSVKISRNTSASTQGSHVNKR